VAQKSKPKQPSRKAAKANAFSKNSILPFFHSSFLLFFFFSHAARGYIEKELNKKKNK
jgi:hypothetical protein